MTRRKKVSDSMSAPVEASPHQKLLAALSRAQGKPDTVASTASSTSSAPQQQQTTSSSSTARTQKKNAPQSERRTSRSSVASRMRDNTPFEQSGQATGSNREQQPSTSRRKRNTSTTVSQSGSSMLTFTSKAYEASQQQPRAQQQAQPPGPPIPADVLADLSFRFISNIPDIEKESMVRICFQVELAHWFYVDFYCKQGATGERKDCKNMGMREFTRQLFTHCDELKPYLKNIDKIIDDWRTYKSSVPTYGAILLDSTMDKVLLVQGFYASKNSWGFPKGKVNQNEDPRDCAIREVREETGFDFSTVSQGGEYKIQKFLNDTMVRLYVVPDVPIDFQFAPQTRNEIRNIQWFDVWDLPSDRYEQQQTHQKFFTVIPFVQDLKTYIRREQARRAKIAPKPVAVPIKPQQQPQPLSSSLANTYFASQTDQLTTSFEAPKQVGTWPSVPVFVNIPEAPTSNVNSVLKALFSDIPQASPTLPTATLGDGGLASLSSSLGQSVLSNLLGNQTPLSQSLTHQTTTGSTAQTPMSQSFLNLLGQLQLSNQPLIGQQPQQQPLGGSHQVLIGQHSPMANHQPLVGHNQLPHVPHPNLQQHLLSQFHHQPSPLASAQPHHPMYGQPMHPQQLLHSQLSPMSSGSQFVGGGGGGGHFLPLAYAAAHQHLPSFGQSPQLQMSPQQSHVVSTSQRRIAVPVPVAATSSVNVEATRGEQPPISGSQSARINKSETSAFTSLKKPPKSAVVLNPIEMELEQLILEARGRVRDVEEEDNAKTPTLADTTAYSSTLDLALDSPLAASQRTLLDTHSIVARNAFPLLSAYESLANVPCTIELCDAWKSFKLNHDAIITRKKTTV